MKNIRILIPLLRKRASTPVVTTLLEFDAALTTPSAGALTNVIGNPWTVTRNSIATYRQDANTLIQVAANVPRIQNGKVLIEGASTNLLLGSTLAGGVDGSPGTAPTYWSWNNIEGSSVFNPADLSGSSEAELSVVGAVRQVLSQTQTTGVITTQTVVFTCKVTQNVVSTYVTGSILYTSSGAEFVSRTFYIDGVQVGEFNLLPTGTFDYKMVAVMTTPDYIRWRFGLRDNSKSGDKTMSFSLPQVEFADTESSFIPTTSAAVTREADVITNTVPPGASTMETWIDGVSDGGQAVTPGATVTMLNGTTKIIIT